MAGQGRNIRLSVDRIAGYRNFGTKLWSASMFGQMNDCNTVETALMTPPMPSINSHGIRSVIIIWK